MISQLSFCMKKLIYLILSSILLTACGQKAHIIDMQCEYQTSPLGIDATQPRFRWKFQSESKNFLQESYQLRIATSIQLLKKNKPDIWTSEKIRESVSRCVYTGELDFESHRTYYWDVTAWDANQNKYKSKVDSFEMAKLLDTDWQAKWITGKDFIDKEFASIFRKSFNLQHDIRTARAYISGNGYQFFLNGQQVVESTPELIYRNQNKRILYATYDITPYLKQDENSMGILLGNSLCNSSDSKSKTDQTSGANNHKLLCELRITYQNGSVETIKSDNTWKTNTGIYTNYIEKSEPKEEIEWSTTAFEDKNWEYARITDKPDGKLVACNLSSIFTQDNITQTCTFKCSDSLLNTIWETSNQSYRNCLPGIGNGFQHGKKNGWSADAHIAIDLAMLNYNSIKLYEKWIYDFIDNQREDGSISGIIESSSWGYGSWPGPVWDAALFIIPNALYNYYGDTRAIEKLYPTMQKYLDYLFQQEKDGMLNFGLGDWVFYKTQTPNDYTSTVYYYLDYKLMARFATLLGKDASTYKNKATELKTLINQKFFNPETGIYANGTQTALALALFMELVPEEFEQKVADNLRKKVVKNDFFLDFGLIGSKTVFAMLARYGYVEDAYKMAKKTDSPSWGYWVETPTCATTTETWTLSPQFRDASLNHVFMGDISAWMYNVLAGINYNDAHPGFQHIIIKPHFVNDLNWVEAEYNSIRGLIKSSWKRKDKSIVLQVTIPPGATATIIADNTYQIGSGTYKYIINN